MIPTYRLPEQQISNDRKDDERDALLHYLQLRDCESLRTNPIGGNLKDIFEKRNGPASEDHQHQWFAFVFQVAIPGQGHKNVRDD